LYKNVKKLISFFLFFCFLLPVFSIKVDEQLLKVVFFERFTRFIEWPASKIQDSSKPFIIGTIGSGDLISLLNQVYKNKTIKNKAVQIKQVTDLSDIDECHIIFLSELEKDKLLEILSYIRNKPILSISDADGYGEYGVIINFYDDKQKVSYEINQSAFSGTGLSLSYLLLQNGKVITS
jgi:hypothetical protein